MITLKVTGMDCGHCVATVRDAVEKVPGAEAVAVDLESGDVRIGGAPDPAAIRAAILGAGYEIAD